MGSDASLAEENIMQSQNRILDDLAHVAGGALGAISGLKQEIEAMIRDRLEKFMANGNFVRRDEFDAVKEMAANARAEQEKLTQKVAQLEQQLASKKVSAARKKNP
jgi:BMFP domain-containing protein YqiC